MKNFLTHKFLPVMAVFMLVIFTLCTSCFASSDLKFSNDEIYNLPDFTDIVGNNDYCIIYGKNTNIGTRFLLLPYDKDNYQLRLVKIGDKYSLRLYSISSTPTDSNSIKYSYYYISSTSSSSWSSSSTSDTSGFYFSGGIYGVYATQDLYDLDGNLVFQVAPQIPEITKTLVEQTTQTQIQEQLKLMITGFLKYLIVFVISVIAFWKGWKFLSKQLKRA